VRSEDRPSAPADFVSLSGFRPKRPHRSCLNGSPLLGFLAPSATSAEGSCAPGLPHPAQSVLGVSHPLDGLLSLRPCGHARSAAAPGVLASKTLSNGKAVTHRCVPVSFRPWCSTASNSEEYEVESSTASQTLEPCPIWSRVRGSRVKRPPTEHIIPGPSQGLSPPLIPPHALSSASRRALLHASRDASDRRPGVFDQPGNQRIYWRSAAPLGFMLHRKTLWRLPVLYSVRHRHARRSRKFSRAFDP